MAHSAMAERVVARHTEAARKKAPKFPSSVDAPSWALKEMQSKVDRAMSSLYPPSDYVSEVNKKLRDQKWGVSVPLPGSYQGQAAIQLDTSRVGGALRKDSGEAEVPFVAYAVNSALPGGSKDIPVKGFKLYLWWEKDADGKGYNIVAKVDKSKPSMDSEKARLQKMAYSYDRVAASALRPTKMVAIEYTYDHPTQGRLQVNYNGDTWYVVNQAHKITPLRLTVGPSDHRNFPKILQNAVDKAVG